MHELPFSGRRLPLRLNVILLLVIGATISLAVDLSQAANRVYVDVVRESKTVPVTNLYIGLNYEFRIWIENDVPLSSLRVTLRNWAGLTKSLAETAELGTYFSWVNAGGYGPTGLNTGHACVTVPTGCRMNPPEYVWDFSNVLRVWEYNMNEVSPDTIGFGGTALAHGLAAGPLQHMASIHFRPNILFLGQAVLHLDSAFIAPGGGMLFVDGAGGLITPEFSTASPWYIVSLCGDVNGDGSINVADAVYLISYIFKGGPAPKPAATGDVNADADMNVADAVYIIQYVFKGGPPPDCSQ